MTTTDSKDICCKLDPIISFALEPAHNAVISLLLLTKIPKYSGLDEWLIHLANTITPELSFMNRVVMDGFFNAVSPDRSWSSFPAYLSFLKIQETNYFRDKLIKAYASKGSCDPINTNLAEITQVDIDQLKSADDYLHFLMTRYSLEDLDFEAETEAFRYLQQPAKMKDLIIRHLETMWNDFLSAEWERNLINLKASVEAYSQLKIGQMSKLEIAQMVYGHELDEEWKSRIEKAKRIIFFPSAHIGPYLKKIRFDDVLWIVYGARIPEGAKMNAPDLSRSEILVRVNALADDVRLRILRLLVEQGEKRSHEIMNQLGLTQSAASRHLKQLSATGYLNERRMEGAKSYSINTKYIENTLEALSMFFLNKIK